MSYIPYGKQEVSSDDIAAVVNALQMPFITQGPTVVEFESRLAELVGVGYAVATNSATSALHVACQALDVGPGDLVWTSAISFVASANCARYCGADVDFVDIDAASFNMSIEHLESKLIAAKEAGRLPKVVIPVHLTGQVCDMEAIHLLSASYGFKVIEDASHAIGARYQSEMVGNCRYSDITVFSFHPVKIITTGEGGMAMTKSQELASRMARLRSHGVTRDPLEMSNTPDGPWYYEQIELGNNYRMTDFQAALGISQLSKLESFVSRRQEIARQYGELFQGTSVLLPEQAKNQASAFHLYVIRIETSAHAPSRNQVFERLRANGVMVNLHYLPIYRHPYYERMGIYNPNEFPNAEKYYKEAISLPMFPGLQDSQISEIVRIVNTPIDHQNIF